MSFEIFWQIYPRKLGQPAAASEYEKAKSIAPEHILRAAAMKYADSCRGRNEQDIMIASRWLNESKWEKEIAPPYSAGSISAGSGSKKYTETSPPRQFPDEYNYASRGYSSIFVGNETSHYNAMVARANLPQTNAADYRYGTWTTDPTVSGIWVPLDWIRPLIYGHR